MTSAFVLCGAAVIAAYQIYVTTRVLRYADSTRTQKGLQSAVIWFIPLAGACLVHAFFIQEAAKPRLRDSSFIPEQGNDGGADLGH